MVLSLPPFPPLQNKFGNVELFEGLAPPPGCVYVADDAAIPAAIELVRPCVTTLGIADAD